MNTESNFNLNEDELTTLSIAESFIGSYISSREGLKKLGILRSERNLQGDYAEWYVSKLMGLKLFDSTVQKGVDAFDKDGKTYQIKSRIMKSVDANTSFDFSDISQKFDYLIGVFFSYEFKILKIIQVDYDTVCEYGSQTKSTFRFRWNSVNMGNPKIKLIL